MITSGANVVDSPPQVLLQLVPELLRNCGTAVLPVGQAEADAAAQEGSFTASRWRAQLLVAWDAMRELHSAGVDYVGRAGQAQARQFADSAGWPRIVELVLEFATTVAVPLGASRQAVSAVCNQVHSLCQQYPAAPCQLLLDADAVEALAHIVLDAGVQSAAAAAFVDSLLARWVVMGNDSAGMAMLEAVLRILSQHDAMAGHSGASTLYWSEVVHSSTTLLPHSHPHVLTWALHRRCMAPHCEDGACGSPSPPR